MQNLTVERMWPEVNHRVNYPVKRKLIEMEDHGLIDMEIPTIKFCVSFVSVNVTTQGLKLFVQAWNAHPVAGLCYNYTCTCIPRVHRIIYSCFSGANRFNFEIFNLLPYRWVDS